MYHQALLVDLDGVVIKRDLYFSERLCQDYNLTSDVVLPFFKTEFRQAVTGMLDIKTVLPEYFAKWGWKGSVEDFLTYWFESEQTVDPAVIELVRSCRHNQVYTCLASDNEINRARYVMQLPQIKDEFDKGFFSCDIGHTKIEPDYFKAVVRELRLDPSDIYYLDDEPKNVAVAAQVGIKTKTFVTLIDFQELYQEISA